jgi:uncharacterized membrane protein YwzB
MIGTLIGILVAVIILGVIWWALTEIMRVLPIAEPFATIARVLMTLIVVVVAIWIIIQLLGVAGIHVPVHM